MVPISSGGLASGVSIACKQLKPEIKVFGAEPELADDALRSLRAGKRIMLTGMPPFYHYVMLKLYL